MTSHPGYSIHTHVFSDEEMRQLCDELQSAALSRTRAGARHVLRVPAVQTLAGDARVLRLARSYVGKGATPYRATFFDKSPAANWLVAWHQDLALPLVARTEDPSWGPWSTKAGQLYAIAPAAALERIVALRVHLDDSAATNGPLRVLPWTHDRGVLGPTEVQQLAKTREFADCLCPRGGVIAMRPLALHASSKSRDGRPRRVLHIEYAPSLDLGPGVRLSVS